MVHLKHIYSYILRSACVQHVNILFNSLTLFRRHMQFVWKLNLYSAPVSSSSPIMLGCSLLCLWVRGGLIPSAKGHMLDSGVFVLPLLVSWSEMMETSEWVKPVGLACVTWVQSPAESHSLAVTPDPADCLLKECSVCTAPTGPTRSEVWQRRDVPSREPQIWVSIYTLTAVRIYTLTAVHIQNNTSVKTTACSD